MGRTLFGLCAPAMLLSILIIFPSMPLIKKAARHADTPGVRRDAGRERAREREREREREPESERETESERESCVLLFPNTLEMWTTLPLCVSCGGEEGVRGRQDGREWSSAS